ncbi:MAG: ABC transporter ATP-binding protein [Pseudomonadota bacterium]
MHDDPVNHRSHVTDQPNLLEARGLVKRFGDFTANDQISLTIRSGDIHALLGENGAGKSTLVKIFYGALQPDSGSLLWQGKPVQIENPAAARAIGIAMVFQHFSLFDSLSVAENIALALVGRKPGLDLHARIREISEGYGLAVDPERSVGDLSAGERQRVEIIRCLLQEPRLIIMDEPTSVLTPQEAEQLFVTLRRLADEGCAILYISHRLEEVRNLCHHATILRHAKIVGTADPKTTSARELAAMMTGHDVHIVGHSGHDERLLEEAPVRLSLDRLTLEPAHLFATRLFDLSLDVRAGEVLAIAGIAGNGQSELFDALSGERRVSRADMISIDGVAVGHSDINLRRRLKAGFVPEERLGHATVPGFRLAGNLVLSRHSCDEGLVSGAMAMINHDLADRLAGQITNMHDVRTPVSNPIAETLSGGNLQKFILGRELERDLALLVVNQPSWGVDAGAAARIRQVLVDRARAGAAILVISQDLDEIFEIADRIAVLSRGSLSEAVPAAALSREQIGLLMAGSAEQPRPKTPA